MFEEALKTKALYYNSFYSKIVFLFEAALKNKAL